MAFETRAWKKTAVLSDIDLCSGCGECAARCAIGAINMDEKPTGQLNAQEPGPPACAQEPQGLGMAGAAVADPAVVAKTESSFSSSFE